MKKIYKVKDIMIGFLKNILEEIKAVENKKRFISFVILWFVIFISIIIVSDIKEKHNKSSEKKEIMVESVFEEELISAAIDMNKMILKSKTAYIVPDTEKTSELLEDVQNSEETKIVEEIVQNEVISIENIKVSDEQLSDDASINLKQEVFYSEPGLVKTSIGIDKSRIVNCIDVSKHQGTINWKKVKESGIDYAFIRVAYRGYETGAIAIDKKFEENIKGALANSIEVGVYFFSQAVNEKEALEEASVILNYIKNYNITLPVVIDWETAPGYRTYFGIGKNKLTSILTTFCDAVKNKGYTPMIYMCQSDLSGRVNIKQLESKYKIWLAWYFECYSKSDRSDNIFKYGENIPDVSYDYDVWQYSKNGYINGISEPVDMNIYILPEKKNPPVFTITNKKRVVNLNEKSFDIKDGISLIDSDGNNITDKLSYVIKDKDGKVRTLDEVLSLSGKYMVYYTYDEISEIKDEMVLYVRDMPQIYYDEKIWNESKKISVEYTYDNSYDIDENIEMLTKEIKAKISVISYETIEEEGIKSDAYEESFDGMKEAFEKYDNVYREYDISYLIVDNKGLKTSRKITLIIKEDEVLEEESLKDDKIKEIEKNTDKT